MRILPLAIVMLAAAPAAADEIGWRAPKGCPSARSLRQRVEKRLEHSLAGVTVGIEVDVSRHGGRYTATIDLRGVTVANDVRTLTSKRCDELADAVAVIVARVTGDVIAHDAAAEQVVIAMEDDPVSPSAVLEAAPPALPHAPIDTLAAPAHKQPRTWALDARLSGVSGIGVIPQVGLGGELALGLRRHDALAELAATRWMTSVAQFHDGAPSKVNVALDVTTARAGWRPARMPLRAWVGVETGTMRGTGVVLPSDQLQSGRWVAAGAGFGVAWQMAPWIRLVGMTETMLAVERVRFSAGDGLVVYAPSPMSFRTICGLEVGWQ